MLFFAWKIAIVTFGYHALPCSWGFTRSTEEWTENQTMSEIFPISMSTYSWVLLVVRHLSWLYMTWLGLSKARRALVFVVERSLLSVEVRGWDFATLTSLPNLFEQTNKESQLNQVQINWSIQPERESVDLQREWNASLIKLEILSGDGHQLIIHRSDWTREKHWRECLLLRNCHLWTTAWREGKPCRQSLHLARWAT